MQKFETEYSYLVFKSKLEIRYHSPPPQVSERKNEDAEIRLAVAYSAGKISVSELRSVFKALIFGAVAGTSSTDLTDAVLKIDKDGDGAIKLHGFSDFHRRE
ncbi:hypothetical protein RHSIM_Rhsim02G0038100 [Rhododendron simsii]|uniref:EF-hand domain-containing protein n=1 Tax=Rhododendron simsii TaxID=118357 RepID=A0A834HER0_RHOSS|nr:hypothetical protein RHSIM_Rhsim02G0038100 [Rhododendron simsii]